MMAKTFSLTVAAVSGLLTGGPTELAAQEWSWPERAKDLRELPADFPPERLSAVMRGFTSALGVRCSYCHVGEEGQPLSTYDFVSDQNPNKDRARAMLRLLGAVNEHLDGIERSGPPVNMWCHTCHAGRPKPQTLGEALEERYEAEGSEAALTRFRELRERYYGAGAYDFTPSSVARVAAEFFARGDTALGRRMLEMNVEDHPDAVTSHEALGDLLGEIGDAEAARAAYRQALELSPGNARIQAKLERATSRLERARPKLERARSKLERTRSKLERARSKLERARSAVAPRTRDRESWPPPYSKM
ncbi:MAG: c-type cytochrome [Longimicrobiales bacterium]|nr:c-type cytochrome [Longimicrobiales bacterium]